MQIILILSFFLAAALGSCIEDSTDPSCSNYQLSPEIIDDDISKLCKDMPYMPGCTLLNSCKDEPSLQNEAYCNKFSILGDICASDMPSMTNCDNYSKLCNKEGSVVEQCKKSPPIPNLPKTIPTSKDIKGICSSMSMDGCEKCEGIKLGTCDLLSVYSQLCKAMPDMEQCGAWNSFCPGSKAGSPQNAFPFCTSDGSDSPPQMRMYFHTGLSDYVLFKEWVPRSGPQYAGTVFAIIVMGIVYELILTVRGHLEVDWTAKSSSKFSDYSVQQLRIDSMRAAFQFVESSLAYLLMLISMTFNVGLFLAVIAGIALGTLLFSRFRAYGSTKRPCGC